MKLKKLIDTKKIIICCGGGGVGKTTLSAAIALYAAGLGKKAVVLTIDPARRLANSLGMDELSDEPQRVELEGVERQGRGEMFAMMLDTKRTFDNVVEKYSPNDATRKAILENRLYQHVSNMLAGSQEYMAMEKLWDIYYRKEYDLIVLDTPPTRHALDFLDAPKRMVDITSNSLLKWFLNPKIFSSGGSRFLRRGMEKILGVFDRLAGFSFLYELSEMLVSIAGLLGGFKNRASQVYNLLRSDDVGFLCVTSPEPSSVQDALFFLEKMNEGGLPFEGFIINRVHPSYVFGKKELKEVKDACGELAGNVGEMLFENLKNAQMLSERDKESIALLRQSAGGKTGYAEIPYFVSDIHDLEGLKRLDSYLAAEI